MLVERETPSAGPSKPVAVARPFLVVVAGEFKSGKSSLINALLRRRLLPTMSQYHHRPAILIRQSATETGGLIYDRDGLRGPIAALDASLDLSAVTLCELFSHTPHLAGVDLVELPFYSDGVVTDDTIAMMAAADLLVWVTIGSQSWRLSEKSTLLRLPPEMREKTVLAVSRADKFRTTSDRQRIADRLNREAKTLVRDILFVECAPDLIQQSGADEAAWGRTGGAALRHLIMAARDRLADEERRLALAASRRSAEVIAFPGAPAEDAMDPDATAGTWTAGDWGAAPVQPGAPVVQTRPMAETRRAPEAVPVPEPARSTTGRPMPDPVAGVAAPAPGQPVRRLSDVQQDRVAALRDITATINGLQAAGIVRADHDGTPPVVLFDAQGQAAEAGQQARACLAATETYRAFAASGGAVEDTIIACGRVTLLVVPSRARGDVLYLLVRHDKTNAAIARTIMRRMDAVWAA